MLQRLLRLLRPKDTVFFPLFKEMSANIALMGRALEILFYEPDISKRRELFGEISDLEQKTDSLAHKIFMELSKTFIIPLDREDIYKLTSSLDDVADNIYGCAKRMDLYEVDVLQEKEFQQFARLVYEAARDVDVLLEELVHLKKTPVFTEAVIRVHSTENKADDLFNERLRKIFEEQDVKTLLKKKELYQILEATIDKCEEVTNVVESIIIKYA